MPILKESESTYTPVPAGAHPARCYGMCSLGTQPPSNPKFNPQFKVLLFFEFPNELIERDGRSKPMSLSHFLNAYLGSSKKPSKTNLFLTSWRGRPFKPEELAGFDLSAVIGAPALINIVHEERNGKLREQIASISPLPKGLTIGPQINPGIRYEIEDGGNDVFNALPEWVRSLILQAEENTTPKPPVASDTNPNSEPPEEDGHGTPF